MIQGGRGVIRTFLEKRGYRSVPEDFYGKIEEWKDWYINGVDKMHTRTVYNGKTVVNQEIKSLGMAKTVAETWANLLMNEKVQINVGNEHSNDVLHDILKDNKFQTNANRLCELYFALGTGAFVEYIGKDKVQIDYIQADLIFPITWSSKGVEECAFGSVIRHMNQDCIYIQMHIKEKGQYIIENHILGLEGQGYKEMELPLGVEQIINTGSKTPLFQILKPNIVNNADESLSLPMGISVYGNATDVLMEIDTAFDALDTEINTGRRIIFLQAAGFQTDSEGITHNMIGDHETIFRSVGDADEDGKAMVHDFSPALRISEINQAIQMQLNLLSEKCGMGTNQFEFTLKGVKTATEVISEDSDMYSNLKKHEIILGEALENMIEAISFLSSKIGNPMEIDEITIDFDDSIIEDKDTERKQDQADLANGTLRPEEYRAKWRNETIEEAAKNLPQSADVME